MVVIDKLQKKEVVIDRCSNSKSQHKKNTRGSKNTKDWRGSWKDVIPGTTSVVSVQKSAVLGTAKILHRALKLPGLWQRTWVWKRFFFFSFFKYVCMYIHNITETNKLYTMAAGILEMLGYKINNKRNSKGQTLRGEPGLQPSSPRREVSQLSLQLSESCSERGLPKK